MAYPGGYWAELVRSSSPLTLSPTSAGSYVWLRTSDGEPLQQQRRDTIWRNLIYDAGEPYYLASANERRPYRFRKTGENWLPSDAGVIFRDISWPGNGIYRFFEQPAIRPSFASPTGSAITGVAGVAIDNVVVPVATGSPAPAYTAAGLPNGLVFNANTRTISGTPLASGSGAIIVTARNSQGTATRTYNYAFTDPNLAPTVMIATQPQTADDGAVIQLAATASDSDGTITTYAWTAGGGVLSSTAIEDPTWTAPARTNREQRITLRLTVTDDGGRSAFAEVVITVRANLLSDWVVPSGQRQVFAALIEVARNGTETASVASWSCSMS